MVCRTLYLHIACPLRQDESQCQGLMWGTHAQKAQATSRNLPKPHAFGLRAKLVLAYHFGRVKCPPERLLTVTKAGCDRRSEFNVSNPSEYEQATGRQKQALASFYAGGNKIKPRASYLTLASTLMRDATYVHGLTLRIRAQTVRPLVKFVSTPRERRPAKTSLSISVNWSKFT